MITFLKGLFGKPSKPAADPITFNLPEDVTYLSLATQGVAHLAADEPFDALVEEFAKIGMSNQDADLAADRIAGGMTRAVMFGDKTRPDGDVDPLALAAFEVMKSRIES